MTAVLTAAAVLPVSAAITRFTDVPDTNIFAEDIAWMDENDITSGCGADTYCPTANVTREQMSAFMHRLATNQVVDAKTLEGMAASDFASAGHSHTGYASVEHDHDADYLAVNGTAADADMVGGFAAGDLIRVASYSFSDDKAPDDYARLATFDIEAPVDGYLMLTSSLEYHTELAVESIWCAFAVDGDGTVYIPDSPTSVTVKTHTAQSFGTCDAHVVAPVTAGPHTITIMGFYTSLAETNFTWGTASALFVPFGPTGSQPVDFDTSAPSPDQMP
jgi:hypothetical protein